MNPGDIIDLAMYPLHDLQSGRGLQLVKTCKESLKKTALCLLPDFIRPPALKIMKDEISVLTPQAHYKCEEHTPYFKKNFSDWPAGHPEARRSTFQYAQIVTPDIPAQTMISKLYQWNPLTQFVQQAVGADSLFRSACPTLSLTVKVAGEGDTDGWHYDGNDFVISLLLQSSECGGEFEYAPYIRTKDDENYEAVARLLNDPDTFGMRPVIKPGTFVLFNGELSLHRVRAVGQTSKPRMIALFSYDYTPDQVFPVSYCEQLQEYPRLSEIGKGATA